MKHRCGPRIRENLARILVQVLTACAYVLSASHFWFWSKMWGLYQTSSRKVCSTLSSSGAEECDTHSCDKRAEQIWFYLFYVLYSALLAWLKRKLKTSQIISEGFFSYIILRSVCKDFPFKYISLCILNIHVFWEVGAIIPPVNTTECVFISVVHLIASSYSSLGWFFNLPVYLDHVTHFEQILQA